MLSQLECKAENRLLTKVFHASDLLRPNILKFKLDALDRQQEAVERVVFLVNVRAEHQMNRPLAAVDQRQATPRVFLI